MARINLLPWRAEERKEREKRFGVATGIALAVTVVIFGLVHLYIQGLIDYQNERNDYLRERIKEADRQIEEIKELETKRDQLLARMKVIQELQASRPEIVHLFDELVKTLPDGVFYTSLKQQGKKITLEGKAQSSARVATLMRQLDGSEWMKMSWLNQVIRKEDKNRPFAEFTLEIEQEAPKTEEELKKEQEKAGGKPAPAKG